MKAVYAALCLGLLSVCRASPLTCDQLLTFKGTVGNLSGRWYLHGLSTDSCVLSNFLGKYLDPSIAVDNVYHESLKRYNVTATVKSRTSCMNSTESFDFDNNTVSSTDETYTFLPSSCSDCYVMSTNSSVKILLLYSRKTSIDTADFQEFERQAACLQLPQPRRFATDYNFENCTDNWGEDLTDEESAAELKKLGGFGIDLLQCLVEYLGSLSQ